MSSAILRALLDRTVTHQRPNFAVGSSGGRTPTYNTQTANVPAAIWPMAARPDIADSFERMDIVTSHVICTDSDIGAKSEDAILDGSDFYLVSGSMKYQNLNVMNVTVYLIAADLRIVS